MPTNQIAQRRKAVGLSALQLAAAADVKALSSIYAYEAGTMVPSVAVARRLADALGCSLDELFPAEVSA